MSLAFAPTLPIYAFKNSHERSDSLKSIENSDMHEAEAQIIESPELIMIDTTSKRKIAEERRQVLTPANSKWQLGFVSHSHTHKGSESPAREESQQTILSKLQIKSSRQSQGMPLLDENEEKRSNELESIRLAQKLAREEFERDQLRDAEEQKTMDLVKALEEEEQRELQRLRDEQEEVEMNEFNCKICLDGFDDENSIFPLQLCEHVFHKLCLTEYLCIQIKESKLPIFCPDPKCKVEISDNDLKDLLDDEQYQKYSNFAFNQAVDMQKDISWCPTADCKFAFVYDPEAEKNADFNCPTCKKHYCLNCRVESYVGQSCKEYQVSTNEGASDKAFLKFVKGKKFKQCPHCNFWVERTAGCDHMACRCGKSFCYKCGGVYGQC